jgi:hypothetical protein
VQLTATRRRGGVKVGSVAAAPGWTGGFPAMAAANQARMGGGHGTADALPAQETRA